jgi:hypothetical protein
MPDYIIVAENCGNCGHIDTEAECPPNCIHKLDGLTAEHEAEIEAWLDEGDRLWNKKVNNIHDPGCTGDTRRCDCF